MSARPEEDRVVDPAKVEPFDWRNAGPRVAVPVADSRVACAMIWDALRQGLDVFPMHPLWTAAQRSSFLGRLNPIRIVNGVPCVLPSRVDARTDGGTVIMATSGTSGEPKLAVVPWASLQASAAASQAVFPLARGDRWMLNLSLAHMGGLMVLIRSALAGTEVVLGGEGGFRAHGFVQQLRDDGVTHVSLVPTQLYRIVRAGLRAPRSIKVLLVGGAALAPALRSAAVELGWPLHGTYGLTETCGQVATQRGHEPPGVATLMPGVEARVVHGWVEVRGPTLFRGYWGDAPLTHGDWWPTGDAGVMRGDELQVLGRADEVIITGGENVHPAQVEAHAMSHPGVFAAVASPEPDPEWGQVIVLRYEGECDEAQLRTWYAREPAHLRPRSFKRVEALERTATGKVKRR